MILRFVTMMCLIGLFSGSAMAQLSITPPPSPSRDYDPPIVMKAEPGRGFSHDLHEAGERIKKGRDSGGLSRAEARALRTEARQVRILAKRYGRDGLSASESRELEMRSHALKDLVEAQRARPAAMR